VPISFVGKKAALADLKGVLTTFSGSEGRNMDVTTVAQEVLNLIQSQQIPMGEDLAAAERIIKAQIDQVGKVALQLHMDQNKKLGYEGSSRPCACGQRQRFVKHRPKTFKTILGQVTLHRAYYHCAACATGCVPYDQQAGLGAMALSPGLAQKACSLAIDLPFEKAAAKLAELTGLILSASSLERVAKQAGAVADEMEQKEAQQMDTWKPPPDAPQVAPTIYFSADGVMGPMRGYWEEIKVAECYWRDAAGTIHRRYRARTEKIDGFVAHAWAVAAACGLEGCRQCVMLADGSIWIWDRLAPVIGPHVKIVDWRHAQGHLWEAGNILHGEETEACKAWVKPLEEHLWEGRIPTLLETLGTTLKTLRSPAKRQAVKDLQTYIENHKEQMAYDRFRAMGLDIGSGLIESACKTVVQQRLKLAGARWKPEHAQRILSLRVCHLNGQWDNFWANRPLAA
jgi:hypothetical protein